MALSAAARVAAIVALLMCTVPGHSAAETTASVPFVGCRSDAQTGPVAAPTRPTVRVRVEQRLAARLAYYEAEGGPGVLGPRGWRCFGANGSSGAVLLVVPANVDAKALFGPSRPRTAGPAIQIDYGLGDTSGRFTVARIAARVFPVERGFVQAVIDEKIVPAEEFPSGPYPDDELVYLSDHAVKYRTPSHRKGLGTDSRLAPGREPIYGAAMLDEPTSTLTTVAVRLPPEMKNLAATIVQQTLDARLPGAAPTSN